MREEVFEAMTAVRAALVAAEAAHPGCRKLAALHGHLARALELGRPMLTDDQFVALGGGTPKTPPPDGGE